MTDEIIKLERHIMENQKGLQICVVLVHGMARMAHQRIYPFARGASMCGR